MRVARTIAFALMGASAVALSVADPWHAFAQTADPDDDDEPDAGDSGDDDADVPDPDDAGSDPDPVDDPTDEPGGDPSEEPGGEPGGDPADGGTDGGTDGGDPADGGADGGGTDDGGAADDGGDAPAPGGDDDDAPAAPGGDDDDDAPAAPGGGTGDDDDDDGAPAAPGGGTGDDDDDDGAPAAPGGGTTGDDDDDDAPAPPAAPATGDDDDDDDDSSGPSAPANPGDDDDGGDVTPPTEFIGDEEITGGGDESEAERLALDERDGIETDREGFRYRSNEFVALDLDAADIAQLRANGFELVSTDRLTQVGGTVHLVRGPARVTGDAALSLIEDVADPGSLSFNHLFDSSSGRVRRTRVQTAPVGRSACGCQIGLIDTGVAGSLSSFRHVSVEQRAFNGTTVAPRLHGTAVAHLFAGNQARAGRPTRIVVADIFSGERSSAGSTYALVRALDWLASRNIPVINVSLAGPRNVVVASTVARLSARGHVIVAAAGNDGPAAPPVFPGAYQNVVAVTAVDNSQRIYRYANRGTYVDFAARGVDVPAINARGETTAATGTSFAAPIVAARLAAQIRTVSAGNAQAAIAALTQSARDLGEPGRDTVYGHGLVPEE